MRGSASHPETTTANAGDRPTDAACAADRADFDEIPGVDAETTGDHTSEDQASSGASETASAGGTESPTLPGANQVINTLALALLTGTSISEIKASLGRKLPALLTEIATATGPDGENPLDTLTRGHEAMIRVGISQLKDRALTGLTQQIPASARAASGGGGYSPREYRAAEMHRRICASVIRLDAFCAERSGRPNHEPPEGRGPRFDDPRPPAPGDDPTLRSRIGEESPSRDQTPLAPGEHTRGPHPRDTKTAPNPKQHAKHNDSDPPIDDRRPPPSTDQASRGGTRPPETQRRPTGVTKTAAATAVAPPSPPPDHPRPDHPP